MKSFNQTLSSLCIFALLTISLAIFTPTVEAELRSSSKRRLGHVDEPKEGRRLPSLDFVGSNPSEKLKVCEGDCDDDDDCEGDLICHYRDKNDPNPVPGCSGSDSSRNDYCIIDTANTDDPDDPDPTTDAPAQAPAPATQGSFLLKLYWEKGVNWQEERFERKWCMRCRSNGCSEGEKIYIYECDDEYVQSFEFDPVQGKDVLIRLKTRNKKDLCFERDDTDIFMRECSKSNQDQLWLPNKGFSLDGDSFEIVPKRAQDLCITQRHHPKAGEEVELEKCTSTRWSDTSKWNRYK
jgi:hypothetical protein